MNAPSKTLCRSSRIVFAVLAALGVPAFADCPYEWIPDNGLPGVDGAGDASIVFDDGGGPALYIGGHVRHAGRIKADGVARWNGDSWQAVGHAFAENVTAFGIYNGALYAAGRDVPPDVGNAGRIARWDGHDWIVIGEFMQGPDQFIFIDDMATYGDHLYVAGRFVGIEGIAASNIARWNGANWSAVGEGTAGTSRNGEVYALENFQGELVAAGGFTTAGAVPAVNVARWNGSRWASLFDGLATSGPIQSLGLSSDRLVLGGSFSHPSNPNIVCIAQWDGTALSPLGNGLLKPADAITVYDGALYAAGQSFIQKFDGSAWSSAGNIPAGFVGSLTTYRSELWAVGNLARGLHQIGAFRWNGLTWRAPSDQLAAWITAFAVHQGALYAGGQFLFLDGKYVFGIARWNDSDWQLVSFANAAFSDEIVAMVSLGDDLFVGGWFGSIGGVGARNVARWNGSTWFPLDAGVDRDVTAMAVYHNELIVGGRLEHAGGMAANHIARWNNGSWSTLAGGISGHPAGLTVLNDELVAPRFGSSTLSRWNGSAWTHTNVNWYGIHSIRTVGDRLYLGQEEGADLFARVISWDGANTSQVGDFGPWSDDGIVTSLENFNGDLVASSTNPVINGQDVGYIAHWDGAKWSAFADGLNKTASTMIQFGDALFVAGGFTEAGGQVTNGFARWAPFGPAITQQPNRQLASTGQQAAFAVTAADATAFQWRHNGVALNDDAHIAGATTANLTIDPVIIGDAGQYDCILTNTCGSTTSNTAPLRVIATVPGKPTLQPAGQPAPG